MALLLSFLVLGLLFCFHKRLNRRQYVPSNLEASIMSNSAAPRDLTFGIEFEFLIAVRPDEYDPRSIPNYARLLTKQEETCQGSDFDEFGAVCEAVAKTLQKAGIDTYPWFRDKNSPYPASKKNLGGWLVTTDDSVWKDEDESGDIYIPMEIVSPKLRTFTGNREQDVETFQGIAKLLDTLNSNYRTSVNETCGVHVHVGHDAEGFSVQALRNLLLFLYTFEPGIEKLHPIHRRKNNKYCIPLRKNLNRNFTAKGKAAVEYIKTKDSVIELATIFDDSNGEISGHSAYNLDNLHSAESLAEGKVTIEFRQHKGTVDAREAVLWAGFVTHLVHWVESTMPASMEWVCESELEDQLGMDRRFKTLIEICWLIDFYDGEEHPWKHLGPEEEGKPGRRF